MKNSYDIVVIGGGAAGLFAASVANALGARTCLIEKSKLGGDCTWYGCIPSKALLRAADVTHIVRSVGDYGIRLQGDWHLHSDDVMSGVREIVQEVYDGHGPEVFEKRGIAVRFGEARFCDASSMMMDGERIQAKRFILCTGSHPVMPSVDGLATVDCLTNENLFQLKKLPASLIVLGGGPIGCELGQALARLGVKVTLIEQNQFLPHDDTELVAFVETALKADGVEILKGCKITDAKQGREGVTCRWENEIGSTGEITAERILVAAGRAPNVEGLDLDKAGVEYDGQGVKVNAYLQTTAPSIFACGDLVPPYQFSHVAAYEAALAVRNALFRRLPFVWQKRNYSNIVWATFTSPELARLGMTEAEARQRHQNIRVYTTPYIKADRARTDHCREGMVKVVTDARGYILGAQVVGAQAAEIIQGLVIAKSQRIKLKKIADAMFIYPTLSELVKKTAAQPLVASGEHFLVKKLLALLRN